MRSDGLTAASKRSELIFSSKTDMSSVATLGKSDCAGLFFIREPDELAEISVLCIFRHHRGGLHRPLDSLEFYLDTSSQEIHFAEKGEPNTKFRCIPMLILCCEFAQQDELFTIL